MEVSQDVLVPSLEAASLSPLTGKEEFRPTVTPP